MSALQVVDRNGNYRGSWYARIMPDDNAIVGLWFTREDNAHARRNLARQAEENRRSSVRFGEADFDVVGGGYGSFVSFQSWYQSLVPETDAFTLMAVVRSSGAFDANANRPPIMGNATGANGSFCYFNASGGTKFFRGQCYDEGGTQRSRVVDVTSVVADWNCYSFIGDGTGIQVLNETTGASSVALAITGRTKNANSNHGYAGAPWAAFNGGQLDAAAFLIANIKGTAPQRAAWKAEMQVELTPFSITI